MFRGIVSQCIVSLNVFCNADDQVNYAAKPVTFIRNTERQVVILNYKSPQGEQEQYEETPWSQKDSTRCNGHFILHFGEFVTNLYNRSVYSYNVPMRLGVDLYAFVTTKTIGFCTNRIMNIQIHMKLFNKFTKLYFSHKRNAGNNV